MDLNLKALIGITYLIPIAITLRKIYTPNFDLPDQLSLAIAKLEGTRILSPRDTGVEMDRLR